MRIASMCTYSMLVGCIFFGLGHMVVHAESNDNAASPKAPTGLLVNLLSEPLGIENFQLRLSWIVNHPGQSEYQSAYQVLVAKSLDTLAAGNGETWDSGKVLSRESSNVLYDGNTLEPDTLYYWKVRTWNKNDEPGPFSDAQLFTTALKDTWEATPIWGIVEEREVEEGRTLGFMFLRDAFQLKDKPVSKAIAHVTAQSPEPASQFVYRLYINGDFVGSGPERGFNDTHYYNSFDVTEMLLAGQENVVAALNYTPVDQRFLFQMRVLYTDGDSDLITSSKDWKAFDGNAAIVDQGNSGHGSYQYTPREGINANYYPFGWNEVGFDDSAWHNAVEKEPIDNLLASNTRNTQLFPTAPISVVEKDSNHYFIDFGRNLLGGIRLDVVGKAGQEIEVRLGEELLEPETVRWEMRTTNTYHEVWTLKDGPQVLENWGYRAFRYAEIVNAPENFGVDNIRALALRHPFDDDASHFNSPDSVLNDVWELCKYTIKGTSLDVYVDTHTRERRNYEGDAYVNQLSQYAVDREFAFPRFSIEYLYYRPTWPTEYKPQSVMMAWNDYMYTGNPDSVAQYYDVLKTRKLQTEFLNEEYLIEKPVNVGGNHGRDLVDWPDTQRDGYVFTTINTVINTFNCEAVKNLGELAAVLGKDEDAEYYRSLAENMRKSINTHLYDAEAGRFRDGLGVDHYALHANAFPLGLGLVDDDKVAPVGEYSASRGMVVSVYGAQFLLAGLYNSGHADAALALMNAVDGNSWGHLMYNLGATMVTEAWDPTQKGNMSFSHAWASAPANMIPRGMFGIVPLEPAFNKFQIKPQPADLAWGELKIPSIKGTISVSFKQDSDSFEFTANIPANTQAKVYVPLVDGDSHLVTHNGDTVSGDIEGQFMVLDDVGSGTHTFRSESAR